jgi:hypothetical protein
MEAYYMQRIKIMLFAVLVAVFVYGCIEDVNPGKNNKPMLWFVRGPSDGDVIFDNGVTFEWRATDWDDDLGMGATYVKLEPPTVEWYDAEAGSNVVFVHPSGWVRVYDNIYDILDFPDSTFKFSVKVVDARGADSVLASTFYVRYDPYAPEIDSVDALTGRLENPNVCHTYKIFAHDIARSPRGATPAESLEYTWRFVRPSPLAPVEPQPEWSRYNNQIELCIDGQANPGEYRFRCQVRDRAGNVTPEKVYKCEYSRP